MKRCAFAVPGDLATPTGGYAYDRRMIAELGELGWRIDLLDLGEVFRGPAEATRKTALTRLLAIPRRLRHSSSMAWRSAFCRKPLHSSQHIIRCWRWCIIRSRWKRGCPSNKPVRCAPVSEPHSPRVQGVIVTSAATARLVAADYGVPAERITVARPGSDPRSARRKAARTASCGCCRSAPWCRARVLTCLIAALATLRRSALAADDRRRPHARPGCHRAA